MNKFQHAKIYKIVDNTSDKIYIGSTCENLQKRLYHHERSYESFKVGKSKYTTLFKIIQNNDYKIELIKLHPCENKHELNVAEGLTIKKLKSEGLNVINRNIAGQTQKEYYNKNKNDINEKRNIKNVCQCTGKFTKTNKAQHLKSKKHCEFIKNQTIINNRNIYNITIII